MKRQSELLDGLPPLKAPIDNNQMVRSQGLAERSETNPSTEELNIKQKWLIQKDIEFDTLCNHSKYMAITITFRDVLRRHWKEKELERLVGNTLKSWKYLYYEKLAWFLIPDVDNNGNYHYHGVIRITKAMMPKFKRNITASLGFIKFKYIDNPQKWYNYCFKEGEYSKDNVYSHSKCLTHSLSLSNMLI